MSSSKFVTAAQAAELIRDGDTVGLMGGGGGLMEATHLFEAVQARFLATQTPRALTMVHALGIGDKKTKGMNCFAHEGLVRRVIGGHWVWSPAMQQLALENKIEAYILPGGVSSQLMREIGAGRPGLISHVGLGTVCDPRFGGGRMNEAAQDDLAEVVHIDGREWLRYKPFPIHVALVRGSSADEDGNISFEHEAANLDAQSLALAARNSGGKVIVQVAERLPRGALKAREVRIPSAWVDAIVVDPNQKTNYDIPFDPAFSGELTGAARLNSEAADHAREVAAAQDETTLRSPVAGEVAKVLARVGELSPAGAPVVTVVDLKDQWVVLNVREKQLQRFTMDAEFDGELPALPAEPGGQGGARQARFKVNYSAPLAQFATWRATRSDAGFDARTFEIHAQPLQPIDGARPGMTVRVK